MERDKIVHDQESYDKLQELDEKLESSNMENIKLKSENERLNQKLDKFTKDNNILIEKLNTTETDLEETSKK